VTVSQAVPGATRNTRQRVEILELLDDVNGFQTPQQLHASLRQRGARVGLTTVYRTLQILADAEEIDTMRLPSGEQLYRRCRRPTHHHHLVCRDCGNTVEIAGLAIERWAERVAADNGFVDISHTIDIFGVCPRCARRAKASGR
jgi:Fur family ferric uptake transcriptional regulator